MKDEPPSYPSHRLEPSLPAEVRELAPQHSALVATGPIARGEVISTFCLNGLSETPSRYSIQIGERQHGLLVPIELTFMNHACDPSAAIRVDHLQVVALRDIAEGEQITFFYPSLEWQMAEPFPCNCGSPRCLRWISGAADLPDAVLDRHVLSPAIQGLRAQHRLAPSRLSPA